MHTQLLRSLLLMLLMLAAAALAPQLRATISMADQRPPVDLNRMVPQQVGPWRAEPAMSLKLVNPEAQKLLDRLYSSTLSRVYVNRDGYRIMVSIAHGKDQSDALQVHKPEICYSAQGFQLTYKAPVTLTLPDRTVAATHLVTHLGQRHEPVTYWVVLGDHVIRGGLDKKLKEMRYSLLQHTLPDGMLVRLSSLDLDQVRAFQVQADFAAALVAAIAPEHRSRFSGLTLP